MRSVQLRIGDLVVALLTLTLVAIGLAADGLGLAFIVLVLIAGVVVILPTTDRENVGRQIAGWVMMGTAIAVALASSSAATVPVVLLLLVVAAVSGLTQQIPTLARNLNQVGAGTRQANPLPPVESYWLAVRVPTPVFDVETSSRQVAVLDTDDWYLAVSRAPQGLIVEAGPESEALLVDMSVIVRSSASPTIS
jgi:hypothetical protein